MPAISILMPCYNVSTTVDVALASLVEQSLTDFEVVAVDDGSTDDTLIRLQDWACRDPRIKILAVPHQGIINALNFGLEACHSDYVARMDADDRSLATRLIQQVELLDAHPRLAVIGSLVKGIPEGNIGDEFRLYIDWINSRTSNFDIQRGLFVQSPFAHPSVAYRKEWIVRVGGYQDHGWAEDYDLWLRLYLAGAQFGKVNQVLLEWRDHPKRLTRTDGYYSMESDLRLKTHYLMCGPLVDRDGVFIWGAGGMSNSLAAKLVKLGCPLAAFISNNPEDINYLFQSVPTLTPDLLANQLSPYRHPAVLVAETNPSFRATISAHLLSVHMQEMLDWWAVA